MVPGPRHPFPFDFAVYDAKGQLAMLIEAKSRKQIDRAWARQWQELISQRMDSPAPAVIMLVTPERVYGWRRGAEPASEPDWEIDARPLLAPYFAQLRASASSIRGGLFEELVLLWIRDVAFSEAPPAPSRDADEELMGPLRGGEIVPQVAA